MADYTVTLKIKLDDCEITAAELVQHVDDAAVGEFGERLWAVGTLADLRVKKIKKR